MFVSCTGTLTLSFALHYSLIKRRSGKALVRLGHCQYLEHQGYASELLFFQFIILQRGCWSYQTGYGELKITIFDSFLV